MKNLFTQKIFPLFLPLVLVLLSGCATSPEKSTPFLFPSSLTGQESKKDPFSDFPERWRLKARENEKKGDLPKALEAWEVVKSFIPDDNEAERKVAQLKKQIPAVADQHFQKGVAFSKTHSYALARKEFLFALYLMPDHAEAIQYLKQKLAGEDFLTYEVKKEDTIKEVARKIYKDPQKDFLIAYFNGLEADGQIEEPLILRMPILDSPLLKRTSPPAKMVADINPEMAMDIKEILGKARDAYRVQNYQETATLTEKVLQYDPANRECRELMNTSYYQLGKQLGQENRYNEALEAFYRIDPGYKDVRFQLAHNRKKLAQAHYIKGVKYFIEEEIEKAIQEWNSTLALEPNYPKAKKDVENAHNLLQKLGKIK